MTELTQSQAKLLQAIGSLKGTMGMSPTVKEIADELSMKPPSVHEALKRLEKKGYIYRIPNKARSIEIIKSPTPTKTHMVSVPIIGKVAAGAPLLANENHIGDVMVPRNIVRGQCFALKVQGDSMIDVGICENDYVVVRQQPIAENNDIVVAMIDDSATVKRLYISGDHIELRPENKRLQPIIVGSGDDLKIVGKVMHVCSQSNPDHTTIKYEGKNYEYV